MKALLVGGSEMLQRSIVASLIRRTHQVRVLLFGGGARNIRWPAQVEPQVATHPSQAYDAARGCDAAIVVHPSISESHPEARDAWTEVGDPATHAISEAGVRRLIHVTSRAEPSHDEQRSLAPIHRAPEWLAIRAAVVYGTGDDPITRFLIMMRSLPAVPMLRDTHILQPLWHEDLAEALAAAVSLEPSRINQIVEIAGPEAVTPDELYERLEVLIDRHPVRLPVPDFVASHGPRIAELLHLPIHFEPATVTLATARENELAPGQNALTSMFGVTATTLDEGLKRLTNELVEQTPLEGVGSAEVKRFSIDIHGSPFDAEALLREFRSHFKDVMPIDIGVEPGSPEVQLEQDAVITMSLPGRGNVQVRAIEVSPAHAVVATLRGHALAGIVRFSTHQLEDGVRFEVMTCDAAANPVDWLTLTFGGSRVQEMNWTRVLQNVAKLARGTARPVESGTRKLVGAEAENVQRWIEGMIQRQRAGEREALTPQEGN